LTPEKVRNDFPPAPRWLGDAEPALAVEGKREQRKESWWWRARRVGRQGGTRGGPGEGVAEEADISGEPERGRRRRDAHLFVFFARPGQRAEAEGC